MNIDGTKNNSVSNAFRMSAPKPTETKFVDELPSKVSKFQPKSPLKCSTRQIRSRSIRSLGVPSGATPKSASLQQNFYHSAPSDAASFNRREVPKPTETKFVDELPSRVKSEPKSTAKVSARQSGPQVFGAKETFSRVAPAAAPKTPSVGQIQNIQVVSDTALVKSSMVEKTVSKNNHNWVIGQHVDDETIAQVTPKENIADGEDTVFVDDSGNFICSIAYEALDVTDDAIDILASLPRCSRERGPAGGPIDRETMDSFYKDLNEKKRNSKKAEEREKSNQQLVYSEDKSWLAYLNGDKSKKRGNPHYSTTFGIARNYRTPAEVEAAEGEKMPKYHIVKPYFKLISDCFEKKWNDQYRSYTRKMKDKGGDALYLADSVFSSIAVNTHEIARNGELRKDARAAIHIDSGHHDESYEVMLCLNINVDGGDLYFPEYGILLKLRHRCVVCFRGKLHKHAVTEIRRKDLNSEALRVTLVAHMMRFGSDTLKKAKESKSEHPQLASQSTSPRFKPSDFEEGGEEESEPPAPFQALKTGLATERESGISIPAEYKEPAFPNFFKGAYVDPTAAKAAPLVSLAPLTQGFFYPPLSGAPVNPMPGYVPHQSANFSGMNMSFIPTYGGISHAQHVQALREQLFESQREREQLQREILAMRAFTAYSQASQQPLFRSNESRDEVAVSSVWHTETCTSPAGIEARGLKRPPDELEIDELLGCMPLEKQARHQKQ
ncbi:hypothetical protein [Estrella lausannensis]|uniref:Uncharacterized protein n=1 Tax=Estrella lausannensis TaxID=483423 RepID=A0A0H5E333_9BACT|nr:hypothetical protein [Estrella lausannensis]CRX37595.1 hypothetical protein ELAC_0234 [Estrella lausannensis]